MIAAPVFAFGLVAFGFLGMGPVTIAVDSYGPVTDNAQSVYELSLIEQVPNIKQELEEGLQHRRELRARQGHAGSERRRGQHVQGDGETGADRNGCGGRYHDDFFDHHGADERPHDQRRQAFAAACAVRARLDYRRRDDLLVYGRVHTSRDDRSLPRGGVHQGEHQAGGHRESFRRGQQEGGGNLHESTRKRACGISSSRCFSPRCHLRSSNRSSSSDT